MEGSAGSSGAVKNEDFDLIIISDDEAGAFAPVGAVPAIITPLPQNPQATMDMISTDEAGAFAPVGAVPAIITPLPQNPQATMDMISTDEAGALTPVGAVPAIITPLPQNPQATMDMISTDEAGAFAPVGAPTAIIPPLPQNPQATVKMINNDDAGAFAPVGAVPTIILPLPQNPQATVEMINNDDAGAFAPVGAVPTIIPPLPQNPQATVEMINNDNAGAFAPIGAVPAIISPLPLSPDATTVNNLHVSFVCNHCPRPLFPPIMQCPEGHMICELCRLEYNYCPVCIPPEVPIVSRNREITHVLGCPNSAAHLQNCDSRHIDCPFRNDHNLLCQRYVPLCEVWRHLSANPHVVESIASRNRARGFMRPTPVACKYAAFGCPIILSDGTSSEHELNCDFRRFDCPFRNDHNLFCQWSGALSEVFRHLMRHSLNADVVGSRFRFYIDPNNSASRIRFRLLQMYNERFVAILRRMMHGDTDRFHLSVLLIGSIERSRDFLYKMVLTRPKKSIRYYGTVFSIREAPLDTTGIQNYVFSMNTLIGFIVQGLIPISLCIIQNNNLP